MLMNIQGGSGTGSLSRRLAYMLLTFVIGLTALVFFAGWLLGVHKLVMLAPGLGGMAPSAALSLLFLGGALLDSSLDESKKYNSAAYMVVPVVALFAILGIALNLAGLEGGLDALLFPFSPRLQQLGMSPATAICLLLAAACLTLYKKHDARSEAIYVCLATLGLLVATAILTGFVLANETLRQSPLIDQMSLQAAAGLATLFAAHLLLRPDIGWIARLRLKLRRDPRAGRR